MTRAALDYMPFGAPASIGIDDTARLTVTDWTGETLDGLDAADIITDDDQTIDHPRTRHPNHHPGQHRESVQGRRPGIRRPRHRLRPDLGKLPANLTITQSSISAESDVVSADNSDGVWGRAGGTVWTPIGRRIGRRSRNCSSRWTGDCARTPVVFDSRKLDPATHARLYLTASSGPLVIQGAIAVTARRRRRQTSHPAAHGPAPAAPSPTNGRAAGRRLRNEVTLWPLPVAAETAITWASMGAWPAIWRQCALTLAELSLVTRYQQPTTITEEP